MAPLSSAADYQAKPPELLRAACLQLAARFGGLLEHLVIVGGAVPTLLYPPEVLAPIEEPHLGTVDLDIGLGVALRDPSLYKTIVERLRGAGMEHDQNDKGNPTYQRWRDRTARITFDFLIAPETDHDIPGTLEYLDPEFAAYIIPGLDLAFVDRERVEVDDHNLDGDHMRVSLYVCGPAAFVVMKLLAFRERGNPKDAYDLDYVLQREPECDRLWARLDAHLTEKTVLDAVDTLDGSYDRPDSHGPGEVARFLGDEANLDLRADAYGRAQALLEAYRRRREPRGHFTG